MPLPATTPPVSASLLANSANAGEVWNEICRLAGFDPATLPDADSLPPWTDEEAAAFKRAIDETNEEPLDSDGKP